MGNERENNNLEVQLLLHDHTQSSEDARYRDNLILHGFYFSLAVLGALIAAIVNIQNCWLGMLIFLLGLLIFFIFSISLNSLRLARNAAWANRKRIEKDPRLKELINTNRWIDERLNEKGEKMGRNWWGRRQVGGWVWGAEIGIFIGWFIATTIYLLAWIGIISFS